MNARWLGRSRVYLLRINVSDSDNENSHAFRPDKNKDRIRDNFCYKGTCNWEQNVLWFTILLIKSSVIVGKIEFTLPSGPPGPFLFYPRNVHLSPISWPWMHFFYIKTTRKVKQRLLLNTFERIIWTRMRHSSWDSYQDFRTILSNKTESHGNALIQKLFLGARRGVSKGWLCLPRGGGGSEDHFRYFYYVDLRSLL